MPSRLTGAAIDHGGACLSSSVYKRSSIEWVLQHREEAWIYGQGPLDLLVPGAPRESRDRKLLIAIPKQDLANATEFPELLKDPTDRLLNLAIRSDLDAFVICTNVAYRNQRQNLTATNLLPVSFKRTLAEKADFKFAHSPLQS